MEDVVPWAPYLFDNSVDITSATDHQLLVRPVRRPGGVRPVRDLARRPVVGRGRGSTSKGREPQERGRMTKGRGRSAGAAPPARRSRLRGRDGQIPDPAGAVHDPGAVRRVADHVHHLREAPGRRPGPPRGGPAARRRSRSRPPGTRSGSTSRSTSSTGGSPRASIPWPGPVPQRGRLLLVQATSCRSRRRSSAACRSRSRSPSAPPIIVGPDGHPDRDHLGDQARERLGPRVDGVRAHRGVGAGVLARPTCSCTSSGSSSGGRRRRGIPIGEIGDPGGARRACSSCPWLVLSLTFAAFYARMVRGNLIETMGEDYIRTARAKGLSEQRVIFKHGLRARADAGRHDVRSGPRRRCSGGAFITETVFNLPGHRPVRGRSDLHQRLPRGDGRHGVRGVLHRDREPRAWTSPTRSSTRG